MRTRAKAAIQYGLHAATRSWTKPHVDQHPHGTHRMGRLRPRRHYFLSELLPHLRSLDGDAVRSRARHDRGGDVQEPGIHQLDAGTHAGQVHQADALWRRRHRGQHHRVRPFQFQEVDNWLSLDGEMCAECSEKRVWTVRDPDGRLKSHRCRVRRQCWEDSGVDSASPSQESFNIRRELLPRLDEPFTIAQPDNFGQLRSCRPRAARINVAKEIFRPGSRSGNRPNGR